MDNSQISEFIEFLSSLKEDEEIGKSIKAKIDIILELSKTEDAGEFFGKTTSIFEEILDNNDLPVYSRTRLWEGLSLLEKINL